MTKKNHHFTAASKSQSFDIERIKRLVKTFPERNEDQHDDEKPDSSDDEQ